MEFVQYLSMHARQNMDWKHLGACHPLSPVIEPNRTKQSISLSNICLFEQPNILVSNLKLWQATKSNAEFGIENLPTEFSQIHTETMVSKREFYLNQKHQKNTLAIQYYLYVH